MKSLLLYIVIIVTSSLTLSISAVRIDYKETVQSKSKTKIIALFKELEKVTKNDNKVLVAYKGAMITLVSKLQKGAKKKKTLFKEGISLIEYAVKSNPNNIEIRFVRLSIQQNAPKFLKYNKHKDKDKAFVLNNLKSTKSLVLKQYILDYILQSKHFSEEEKNIILQKQIVIYEM
jgi:hypothetical protein|tara:strand:+ start:454 stop:978 length:525 start_codon:yes stop_codon:yes gene_type:complete